MILEQTQKSKLLWSQLDDLPSHTNAVAGLVEPDFPRLGRPGSEARRQQQVGYLSSFALVAIDAGHLFDGEYG